MELVARPYSVAAAALAAVGLIAATPTMPPLHGVQAPGVGLASDSTLGPVDIVQAFLDEQGAGSSPLISHVLDADTGLSGGLGTVVPDLADVLPGSVDQQGLGADLAQHFLDANSLLAGAGDGSFLGTLAAGEGVASDALAPSLAFTPDGGGAPAGAAGSQAAMFSNAFSVLLGTDVGDNALAAALQSEAAALSDAVVQAEQTFNASLAANEQAVQVAVLGHDSALSGVATNAFNVLNLVYYLEQAGLNDLLGASYDPTGGLSGMSGQFQALMTAIADLKGVDLQDVFANFNAADFQTAMGDLFTTLGGGPFGDAFDLTTGSPLADMVSEFGTVWSGLLGIS